jgi:magnesium transporter
MLQDADIAPDDQEIAIRTDNEDLDPDFVARVVDVLARNDGETLKSLCGDMHEADLGDLLEALGADQRVKLINLLGADFDFTALTEVDDAVREEILEEIPNEAIAEGVRDLDHDDAVYILEDLAQEDQDEVLAKIPSNERIVLERSLDYPEQSAGRRMQVDLMVVPPWWTIGQTIDFLRDTEELPEKFYEIHVVDPGHKLIGTVALDTLLRTRRPERIDAIMVEAEHSAQVDDDQEDVARLFQTYNLVSIPVLDADGRLVGALTFDDITDVINDEVDEDILAMGGVKAEEELSDTVVTTVRNRFQWLFINLITAFAAAAVISLFENAIEKMVALAVLMPIVASMGGNAATQTMTVTVRAIATKDLTSSNTWRVIRREIAVGMLNGVGFAVLVGVVAAWWFGPLQLGFVIATAIVANLLAAALAGVLVPIALNRAGVDPAIASGTFVTTVTDLVGFFAFLGVAALWFGLL